jgi:hypothetical protein
MKGRHHTPEQVIRKLAEGEKLLAQGKSIEEVVSAVLITRIAACWRKGELSQLRDEDGEAITEAEGKAACTDRFKIDPKVRAARRRNTPAKVLKNRAAGRGRKESARKVAPAFDPRRKEASENVA